MHNSLILEAGNIDKIIKCPFCDFRGTKEDIVIHIEDDHEEMIPEEHTAAQTLFNILNKKDHGTCIVCKKETKWDENKWRYDRVCSEKCARQFTANMQKGMLNRHGVKTMLNDPEHQKKMLDGKKSAGEYTFEDGGKRSYVANYEKNRLEFMDKVLNMKSTDIVSPGPVIEYEYNGKKHFWITDAYIISANLVIDDKPGGSNPNTHPNMKEYFAKQEAKELAIKKQGQYNYLRLTDNDFSQLLAAFMIIKKNLLEGGKNTMMFINEAVLESKTPDVVYMITYGTEYTINNIAYCQDAFLEEFIVPDVENESYIITGREWFKPYDTINLFKINTEGYIPPRDNNPFSLIPIATRFIPNVNSIDEFLKSSNKVEHLCQINLKEYNLERKIKELASHNSIQEDNHILISRDFNTRMSFGVDENGTYYLNEATGMRTNSFKDKNIDILEKLIIRGEIK